MKSNQRYLYFWFDLLIFGALTNLVSAKAPLNKDETPLNVGDYSYGEDEEIEADQMKAHPNSTMSMMPYFEEKKKTVYIKPGEKIVLDCPVKNYNESKHEIMWLKEKEPITNGQISLSKAYKLDSKFNLIIEQYTDKTPGNYYCNVMPQNVHRHLLLTTNDEPKGNNQNMLTTSITTIAMVLVVRNLITTVQLSSFMEPVVH